MITAIGFVTRYLRAGSQEGNEVYNAGQLAPGLVLPVVIQQPREDGEVGQGEDHADGPQPGLPGPALRGSGAQQTGVNSEHLMSSYLEVICR